MADGVIAIPLAGQPMACAARVDDDCGSRAALRHFLAGPENHLVEPAVQGVLGPRPARYNPLVLHGPSGTGKSHLACGLVAAWRDRWPTAAVVYTTAVDFARELADAIETQAVVDLRTLYRRASLLVFEDVGRLAEKPAAQIELIGTLDAILRAGGQIVVTASIAPAELRNLMPALQSRLLAGLAVPLSPPGAGARLAILRQLAELREIDLAEPVAQVLADGLSSTVPELLGALVQLDVPARMDGKMIDAEAVRRYLAKRRGERELQLPDIATAAARYFSLKLADLRGPGRRRPVVTARDVAMFLTRCLTGTSLQQIGQYFGGRDHTTVLHGCRKTESLLKSDPIIRQAIEKLKQKLQS
jgi:chromosomal replication initiator protein